MDLPTLHALLRVNGYSPKSSPEEIKGVLIACGYTEEEIPTALGILHGKPPPVTFVPQQVLGSFVASVIDHTKSELHETCEPTAFGKRIGIAQFWLATGILVVLLLIVAAADLVLAALYGLASGLPLTTLPDLATAPMDSIILLGLAVLLIAVPFITFGIFCIGLQIRRYHDLGLSATAWFSILAALIVAAYVFSHGVPDAYAPLIPFAAILIAGILLSWPATKKETPYGVRGKYPSPWAAILGSRYPSGNLKLFLTRSVFPILYIQCFGIVLAFCIHVLAPRVSIPLPPKDLFKLGTSTQTQTLEEF